MSVMFSLLVASLLAAQVFAGEQEVPLVTQCPGLQAWPLLNTSCPAVQHNIFDMLWISESEENNMCRVDSKMCHLEGSSIGLAKNQRDCITGSSAVYCVYLFSDFARGRGLSVVASPSVIPTIRYALSALDPRYELDAPGLFFEKPLPGRGIGLISNHAFKKGDLILTSTPLFMIQERAMSDMSKADRLQLQRLSISALPARSRALFYDLAAHFGGDKTDDVLLTNGFSATFGDSKEGFGIVVPEAARLNHDCRPNARFAFDPRTMVHKIHAARAIEPGEELTVSYIDEKEIYSARQQHIKAHWGFDCECKLCSAPGQVRNTSDTHLRRITALRKSLFLFTVENCRKVTPDMALELVSLYEEEGLHGALAEAYMVTSLWYCVWGNVRETKKWASLAIENWLVWEAGGEANLQGMRNLTRQPQS
ncbi:hypothetical protein BKA64DRAFT_417888 [Cadophora sp. MPI-SDFR-AT-0126]|nr:hypothetical protein BKA64DRAFT_417888 [Leotiomycetes sp. MPI-SDFR-AT-0126]